MKARGYDIGKFEREYNSPSNEVLDSLAGIEAKAEKKATHMKLSVDEIYTKLGFDPISYQLDNNKYDAWTEEVEDDILKELDKFVVPKYNRKMTTFGAAMMVLQVDPKNILGGKRITADGIPVNTEVYPVKKAFDGVNYIIGGIIKHKKALAIGAVAALVGLYASNAVVNANKEEHGDDTDRGITQAENQILSTGIGIGGAASLLDAGNASAVTATPTFDYYDEEFKVGINIEDGIEGNVTKMLKVMKEKTPDRYREVISYAPKKIVVSNEGYNYYWDGNGFREDDGIALDPVVIELGGRDINNSQLAAAENLYGELIAAMVDKTGMRFKNNYEAELYIHSKRGEFRVDVGLNTKEEINRWLERGGWFEAITGRRPTAEDLEGVDITKYLIK